jgi:TRAP-type C4-dicarboxylate transport system substrate-binding protein
MTQHILNDQICVTNKQFFYDMDETDRQLLQESALDAAEWASQRSAELDSQFRQQLVDKGMQYIDIDLADFRNAMQDVYQETIDSYPPAKELINSIIALR